MAATLGTAPLDASTRNALRQFFEHSSGYIVGKETARPDDGELAARWAEQRVLDDAIASSRDGEAIGLAPRFVPRPAVFAGLLARMVQSARARLTAFVVDVVERDASLATRRFGGRTLLHYAAAALVRAGADVNSCGGVTRATALHMAARRGHAEIARTLLDCGTAIEARDSKGVTPLERGTNCRRDRVVHLLAERGARSKGRPR